MGYNLHLPGIAKAKEVKRLERAQAWHRHNEVRESLIAYRAEHGTEAYIESRLSGSLRQPGGNIRKAPHG